MTDDHENRPRVVLVVGAGSGIGLAGALRFAARGDRLVLAGRSEESLAVAAKRALEEGAAQVDAVRADVSVRAEVDAAVERTLALHGRIDVVVDAAAVMAYGTVETVPAEIFEQVVRTAVFGTANVARATLPVFRRQGGGTLIVVNSLLGSVTVPQMGAYSAAKWGQRALVRTLQQEVRAEAGVAVCLVSPGSVNTPIYYQAANYLGRELRPPRPVRSPDQVGRAIARLADRPRANVSIPVGIANPVIISGFRLFPFVYDRLVNLLFRLLSVTRTTAAPGPGNVDRPRPDRERLHGRWPDRTG